MDAEMALQLRTIRERVAAILTGQTWLLLIQLLIQLWIRLVMGWISVCIRIVLQLLMQMLMVQRMVNRMRLLLLLLLGIGKTGAILSTATATHCGSSVVGGSGRIYLVDHLYVLIERVLLGEVALAVAAFKAHGRLTRIRADGRRGRLFNATTKKRTVQFICI